MKTTEEVINGVKVIRIEPGNTVLCDLCNEDYTNSDEPGGFLFSGKAVCPKCAYEFMKNVEKYNETHFVTDRARSYESFREFVYRIRKEV